MSGRRGEERERVCLTCPEVGPRPISEFDRVGAGGRYRSRRCRDCRAEDWRVYYRTKRARTAIPADAPAMSKAEAGRLGYAANPRMRRGA